MIQKLCSRFVHTKHNGKYETIKFRKKKIKKNLACFILKKYKHIRKKTIFFIFVQLVSTISTSEWGLRTSAPDAD